MTGRERRQPPGHPYVAVVHKRTGRAYGLDRQYRLAIPLMTLAEFAQQFGEYEVIGDCDGWTPTSRQQQPAWAHGIQDQEFRAYWLAGH